MPIIFEIPGADDPGFLRRQREIKRHLDTINGRLTNANGEPIVPTIEHFDAMIEYLVQFVKEPADRNEAREALLDLPRSKYNELLTAVRMEDGSFLSATANEN